ncbi:MAG: flagellar biosynthesis protein FliQ [Methylococcales bacterium]|nr:flagellar biosynthesis protein FliQ [Methylococcales bacterium]
MSPESVLTLGQNAMILAAKLSLPILLPSLIVGLMIAMFQAATQINEMTLTFVPKLFVIGISMVLFGAWMLRVFLDFFTNLIRSIPAMLQ